MILHIIGGGAGQLSAIRRCRTLGITTFVTDMDISAPGCLEADFCAEASTFDPGATLKAIERFNQSSGGKIEAMLVTGTDQPVLTAAVCARKLGIPYFLDPDTALGVTNKKAMKNRLQGSGIPVAGFRFITADFTEEELRGLNFPVVVKPLDSQGQRGVYRLDGIRDVGRYFEEVRSFGSCAEILVEEYIHSDEITVSGWLDNGSLSILSVTDRVRVDNPPGIGVCISHHYPSRYAENIPEITDLTRRTAEALGLRCGPLYFQFLVAGGPAGNRPRLFVNEAAARLGGAYEDEFIPAVTGVDILDVMIRMSCGLPYDRTLFNRSGSCIEKPAGAFKAVSVQMFFCREGVIQSLEGMEDVRNLPGIISGDFLLKPGTIVRSRMNSTQRAGYFIAAAGSQAETDQIVSEAYSFLKATDSNGKNLIEFYDKMLFGGNK